MIDNVFLAKQPRILTLDFGKLVMRRQVVASLLVRVWVSDQINFVIRISNKLNFTSSTFHCINCQIV